MAINTSLPTRLLLDETVPPAFKVLYSVLDHFSDSEGKVKKDIKNFTHAMRYVTEDGTVKTMAVESVESAINHLVENGYIKQYRNTLYMYGEPVVTPKKEKVISNEAQAVLDHFSDSAITREYRKKRGKSKADLELIQRFIERGYTEEDLKGFINFQFEREYIKKNPQYCTITTMFGNRVFNRDYPLMNEIEGIRDMIVSPFGLEHQMSLEDDVCTM